MSVYNTNYVMYKTWAKDDVVKLPDWMLMDLFNDQKRSWWKRVLWLCQVDIENIWDNRQWPDPKDGHGLGS